MRSINSSTGTSSLGSCWSSAGRSAGRCSPMIACSTPPCTTPPKNHQLPPPLRRFRRRIERLRHGIGRLRRGIERLRRGIGCSDRQNRNTNAAEGGGAAADRVGRRGEMVRTWRRDDWWADSLRTVHGRSAVRHRGVLHATRWGSAGRRGDFLTSPEVGPLFGAVLARAIRPGVGAARPARHIHRRRRRCRARHPRQVGVGRRAAVRRSDALRGGGGLRHAANAPS